MSHSDVLTKRLEEETRASQAKNKWLRQAAIAQINVPLNERATELAMQDEKDIMKYLRDGSNSSKDDIQRQLVSMLIMDQSGALFCYVHYTS